MCFPFFLIIAAADLYLVVRAVREWYLEVALPDYGIIGEARITNCQRRANRPGSYYYYVTFRLDLDGKYYEIEQMVSRKNYLQLYPGGFVQVSYFPQSPRAARLAQDYRDTTQRNAFTLGAVVIAIVTLFFWGMSFK